MTREEFFEKVDEQLRIRQKDGWHARDKAWSVYHWAKRLTKRVNPVPITDKDLKDHLAKDQEIADFLEKYQIDIDDIVNRVV